MSTPTAPLPADWTRICQALYPQLSAAEQAALVKIWEANYNRFAPLKSRLDSSLDPDLVFDPQP